MVMENMMMVMMTITMAMMIGGDYGHYYDTSYQNESICRRNNVSALGLVIEWAAFLGHWRSLTVFTRHRTVFRDVLWQYRKLVKLYRVPLMHVWFISKNLGSEFNQLSLASIIWRKMISAIEWIDKYRGLKCSPNFFNDQGRYYMDESALIRSAISSLKSITKRIRVIRNVVFISRMDPRRVCVNGCTIPDSWNNFASDHIYQVVLVTGIMININNK